MVCHVPLLRSCHFGGAPQCPRLNKVAYLKRATMTLCVCCQSSSVERDWYDGVARSPLRPCVTHPHPVFGIGIRLPLSTSHRRLSFVVSGMRLFYIAASICCVHFSAPVRSFLPSLADFCFIFCSLALCIV